MEQKSTLIIEVNAKNAERNTQRLVIELRNLQNNSDRVSTSLSQTERQASQTSNAFRSLATQMAGIVTVGAAIAKVDAYTGLQNKLKLVTTTQEELNIAMADTFRIAQQTASSWEAVNDVYSKYMFNAKELNLTQETAAKLTEITSKAVAISGSTAQAAAGALFQYGQALDGGVFRAQEFNSVIDGAGGLITAMALGLNITRAELRQMMLDGKLTMDVVTKALLNADKAVDDLFNKTDFTIGNEMERLSNAVTLFVGEANKGTGAASVLGGAIKTLAGNLQLIADTGIVVAIGLLTKAIATKTTALVASTTASLADTAAATANAQAQLAQAIAAQNLARSELAATAAMVRSMVVTNAQSAAMVANARAKYQAATANVALAQSQVAANAAAGLGARALAALVSPVGLLTVGATAVAAAFLIAKNRAAEKTKALEDQKQEALALIPTLEKLKGVEATSATDKMKKALEEQNKALRENELALGSSLIKMQQRYSYDSKIVEISNKTRLGVMSYSDALEELNKLKIDPKFYDDLRKKYNAYDENRSIAQKLQDGLKKLGVETTIVGNKTENAAMAHVANTNAMINAKDATDKLRQATEDYNKTLSNRIFDEVFLNKLTTQHGDSEFKAKLKLEALRENEKKGVEGVTDEQIKMIDTLDRLNTSRINSAKATKEAIANQKKEAKQLEKDEKAAKQLRESITERFADDEKKIELQLQKDLSEIRSAGFSPETQAKYIEQAKNRAADELMLYRSTLASQIGLHRKTEEEKLNISIGIEKNRIITAQGLNKDYKKILINDLEDRHKLEVEAIRLTNKERILEAQKAYMSEDDYILQKYKLESAEIEKVTDQKLRAELQLQKSIDLIRQGTTASGEFLSAEGGGDPRGNLQRLDDEYAERIERMKAGFEQIKEETIRQNGDLIAVEKEYQNAKEQLQKEYASKVTVAREQDLQSQLGIYDQMLSSTGAVFGQMTSIINEHKEENTKTYKTMFALNKALAIAQAIVNTEQGVTEALKLGAPGVALSKLIRVMGYTSVGIIAGQAFAGPSGEGYKSGGYTGNGGVNEVAGVVHGQEYVLNAEATNRIGRGTLDAINSGRDVALGSSQPVIAETNVVLVDEREKLGDYLYTPDGKRSMIKFIQQHADEIGI